MNISSRRSRTDVNSIGAELPSSFPGCIPEFEDTYTWAYWVPMAAFESVLFVLAIAKSIHIARSESNTPKVLTVLLRDSVLYFGGVMFVILTNLIIWASVRVSVSSHRQFIVN